MEPEIIQGMWDEVAPKHAASLSGHRVEIRVLDGGRVVRIDDAGFEASMARISDLTKDAAMLSARPLKAEDFYESAE